MNKKLFAGRLPFEFKDEELRALFSTSGTVVAAVMVPDPKNGRSRGFGFVDMSTAEEAQAAIQALNGKRIGTKDIWVTLAREKGEAPAPRPSFNKTNSKPAGGPARRPKFGENRFGAPRRPSGHFTEPRPPRFGAPRPFSDRTAPPSGGPAGPRGERRPFRTAGAPPGERRSGPPSRFPRKEGRPGGAFRGPPKRSGNRGPRPQR